MIDRELWRTQPELLRRSLERRGESDKLLTDFLQAEVAWKAAVRELEPLQERRNKISRLGRPDVSTRRQAHSVAAKIKRLEETTASCREKMDQAWARIPNLVANDVPDGPGETANTMLKRVGTPRQDDVLPHHQLMSQLGWLDLKTAARFSGSRFRYLLGGAALASVKLMHEALIFALKNGFRPVIPPVLTRKQTLEKSGFFPFCTDDIFQVERDSLYLTGTSEQTLLALGSDRVYEKNELPVRWVGFSTCFRREAGSYGRDVEGMFRTHQFDKVEMVSFTVPENSAAEHRFLVELEERFTQKLSLPYQMVLIGSGDLGATAAKKIDLETWFPSQKRYRETHSASNCTDYQARRFNIRYRDSAGEIRLVHTLNATLATERLLLAAVENGARGDGRVILPGLLR